MYDDKELIRYRHKDDNSKNAPRFIQYADVPVPVWAADVEPYEEKLIDEY